MYKLSHNAFLSESNLIDSLCSTNSLKNARWATKDGSNHGRSLATYRS